MNCMVSKLEIIGFTYSQLVLVNYARNVFRQHTPELLNRFHQYLIDRINTRSTYSVSQRIKFYFIDLYSYECSEINCYVCNLILEWQVA